MKMHENGDDDEGTIDENEETEEQTDEETSDVDKKVDVVEDDAAESDEDSYVETVLNNVFNEYDNAIGEHVPEPETLEEYSKNRTIVEFVCDKIINKFADDFGAVHSWKNMDVTSKWARLARKRMGDDNVDATSAMKRVLRSDDIIKEWVIEHIEDMENEEDEEDDNDE